MMTTCNVKSSPLLVLADQIYILYSYCRNTTNDYSHIIVCVPNTCLHTHRQMMTNEPHLSTCVRLHIQNVLLPKYILTYNYLLPYFSLSQVTQPETSQSIWSRCLMPFVIYHPCPLNAALKFDLHVYDAVVHAVYFALFLPITCMCHSLFLAFPVWLLAHMNNTKSWQGKKRSIAIFPGKWKQITYSSTLFHPQLLPMLSSQQQNIPSFSFPFNIT